MISFLAVTACCGVGTAHAQQMIGQCPVLPANNIWNTAVDTLPVLSNSAALINTIGPATGFHADFGAGFWNGGPIGIPFVTVPGSQPRYPATFFYAGESDPGPYAIPLNAPIEGGSSGDGDRHAIAIDTDNCVLYELYRAFPQASSWKADAGAVFDLRSNALRPATWTSADAAGLPIMPGLVTYDEVLSGEIKHAIRFTVPQTRREFVWPARHYASSLTGAQYPRMGERLRLKASFDISPYPAEVQVILRAMKKYGIMLADNGGAWFITGKPDSRWNDDNLQTLHQLRGADFEAVDATVLQVSADSGEARQSGVAVSVSPTSATVRAGRSQTFTASVTGAAAGVTWSVNNLPGGDSTVGVIGPTGDYVAPTAVPNPATVTIRATSTSAPGTSGTATATVVPTLQITSVTPASFPTGNFTIAVDGAGFIAGSVVSFDGALLPTSVVSSTRLTATGNAPAAKASVPVSVRAPDGEVSNTLLVTVTGTTSAPPQAPTVSIATPVYLSSFSATTPIAFTASATDSQDGDLTSTIRWTSNLIGPIGTGGNFSRTLPVGVHGITAVVTDSGGLSDAQFISITITNTSTPSPPANNTAPTVTIATPVYSSSFAATTSIAFAASAADSQDGDLTSTIRWTSNLIGPIGTGNFSRTLPVGVHGITAVVTDSGGQSDAQFISITITNTNTSTPSPPANNTAPTVTIATPVYSSSFAATTPIAFAASATDSQDGDLTSTIRWTSSLIGPIGTGNFSRTLPVGVHGITAVVTDSGGLSNVQFIVITITSATASLSTTTAPAVSTATPVNASSLWFGATTAITFAVSASGSQDGHLTASIRWTPNLIGPIGTGGSVSRMLPSGVHAITTVVSDRDGLSNAQLRVATATCERDAQGAERRELTAGRDRASARDRPRAA